jgi:hypothetical protein
MDDMAELERQMQGLNDDLELELQRVEEDEENALQRWQDNIEKHEETADQPGWMQRLKTAVDPSKREMIRELMAEMKVWEYA